MATERPNILFLMTDQHRWDTVGCLGNDIIKTPSIDSLAGSGVLFTNACTTTPLCVPARLSFITGRRLSETRWIRNAIPTGGVPEFPTIMTLLRRQGYWTQGIGKMHFFGRHFGFCDLISQEECVDHWIDDDYIRYLRREGVRTRFPLGIRDLLAYQPQTSGIPLEHSPNNWVADRACEFLTDHKRYRSDTPFFLWTSWIAPHPPFAACDPYDSMYDSEDMELPFNTERALSTIPSHLWKQRARLDNAHKDPDRIRRIRSLYYGQVSHVDDAVGRVLSRLEALGLAENTAVLFFSDHGDMLGDHGLSRKGGPYESVVRVPLIMRWPGKAEGGRRCHDLVGLTDVLPTLIDELGLSYPNSFYGSLCGETLLGKVGGGLSSPREYFAIDYGEGASRWICLRGERHKYTIHAEEGLEELYDIRSDPDESRNLVDDEGDLADSFRDQALNWERRHGLVTSFLGQGGGEECFRRWPPPEVPDEKDYRMILLNQGLWPRNLPEEERSEVESFSEAFSRAISKEATLAPEKLAVKLYKEKGGESLEGTPWEDYWRRC
jgi:arylsulfatase A-like enzyme